MVRNDTAQGYVVWDEDESPEGLEAFVFCPDCIGGYIGSGDAVEIDESPEKLTDLTCHNCGASLT